MAPVILFFIVSTKYFEMNPINKILPQVNKRVLWKPMIMSVKIKLSKTKGKNFKPSKAGT